MNKNLELTRPLVFFDLETTGTNVSTDRIVEISILTVYPDGTEDSRTRLINPGKPIPAEASEVHGITDDKVKDAPSFAALAKALFKLMSGCDFGGFNLIKFDIPLLAEEFNRCNIAWPVPGYKVIDVSNIFRKYEQRTLTAAYKFYCQKEHTDAHGAEADNRVTLEILLAQLARYEDLPASVAELHTISSNGVETLDLAGKIGIDPEGDYIYNFGNDKGKKIKDFPSLAKWALTKDFSEDTKTHLKKIINANS